MNGKIPKLLSVALAFSTLLSGLCQAATVSTSTELLNSKPAFAYVFSTLNLEAMYRLGVEEDKKFGLQPECKTQYHVKAMAAIVLKPIDFPEGKPNPSAGIWLTRYQLERCGDAKIYNALFFANANSEAPVAKPFYPGSTIAGPVLVKDAMMQAVAGALARAGLKDCKIADVFDMRVTEPVHDVTEGDKLFKGVWNEIWTFRLCGQMVDTAMTFIPDANGGGTSFSSGPVQAGANSQKK